MNAPFDLAAFLPYRLAVVAQRVSRAFAQRYRDEFGLSVAEWRVLAHLAQSGNVSVREVFARVELDKPRVSRAAARLEAAGYVSKQPDPRDGRLVALALSPAGRALMDRLMPMAQAFDAELDAILGPDARRFRDMLARLGSDLDGERGE